MSKNKFLDMNLTSKSFFDGFVPLKPVTYCVVIIYINGFQKEIYGIENPWQFQNAVKKNVKVRTTYIKSE